jgi:FAD/FMN-containing dehydrogenase
MVGVIPHPAAKEALEAHLVGLRSRLRGHTTGGAHLNFLEGEERVGRTKAGFTEEGYRRLQALKRRLDPQNLFRYGIDLAEG